MYKQLINKESKLAVIGLGYVGLPLAMAFAEHVSVTGFDIDEERLVKLRKGMDPVGELNPEIFKGKSITFTSSVEELGEASFYIVTVPTPIDKQNQPDLSFLLQATQTVGKLLNPGDYVVYESTVYPGCTEEKCLPLLEELSGLKAGTGFQIGYSPERINPGDKKHTLKNTVKIISAGTPQALDEIEKVYALVVEAGLHKAPGIQVAEAAKIIENTQRDVNIALMNELSILFGRMEINTFDVLQAAATKWNFLPFFPGLVGGHCIGVDPYYLVYKARELKYHPQMINSGRFVNDSMGGYIGKKIVKKMIAQGKNIIGTRVLVMGITFKEDVSDVRNSKVVNIIEELKDYGIGVDVIDPYASADEVKKMYDIDLLESPGSGYDAVIVAVAHKHYLNFTEEYFLSVTNKPAVLGDVKGIYRGQIRQMAYWSL